MEDIYEIMARKARQGVPFVLVTVVGARFSTPREIGAKMLVFEDASIWDTIGGGFLEAIATRDAVSLLESGGTAKRETYSLTAEATGGEIGCGGEADVFFDVHRPKDRLVIVGAGHVGQKLCAIASEAGFPCVVLDDRAEFANRERFGAAQQIALADLSGDPLAALNVRPQDWIVIVTRCPEMDEAALLSALKTPARYIGLIGSRKKVGAILHQLEKRGYRIKNDPRIYSPIGLDLGDDSPGEISISILAEILKLRSQKQASHQRIVFPLKKSSATDSSEVSAG